MKKISQETFDDVVKENIDDFDMAPSDALRDAIEQFVKQGVSLKNIDISGGVGRSEMLQAVAELKKLVASNDNTIDEKLNALSLLNSLCSTQHDLFIRNQMMLCESGCINTIHLLFDADQDINLLIAVMNMLNELSKNNEEIRDFFEPGGCAKLCAVLRRAIENSQLNLISVALNLGRTVNKSENNKFMLMRSGVGEILVAYLNAHATLDGDAANALQVNQTIQEACQLVRALCVHDDLRKDMSCAYENGRFFLKQNDFVKTLSSLSAQFKTEPSIASAALHAMRNFITTEESVLVVSQHGAIDLITAILGHADSSLSLARSAAGLMRNVCADDVRKDKLVSDGTLDLLVNAMAREVYACDASFVEHALATLAAMSLRSPGNSERIVANGMAVDIIVRSMRRHVDKSALQRQGCLTIRNIAARCPDLRNTLMDAGVEPVLRAAGTLPTVVDEAYAALRDLGVDIKVVKINESGFAVEAYEAFGAAKQAGLPARFNPVYDDDDGYIQQRVQEEARAPLRPDRLRDDDEHVFNTVSASSNSACCDGHVGSGSTHAHDHDHSHAH